MKSIITPEGYIRLKDTEGKSALIGQIRNGITFNLFKSVPRKVRVVEFKLGKNTDPPGGRAGTFYFHNYNPVFHHIGSREEHPLLTKIYMLYFLEESTYTPESFVNYVCKNYFVEKL
ncbi:MAG: hypothetical protein IT233_08155 [Bacteroidia bacterium]|nr:hypothetical protein [Bacteroidia bacterium]